MSSSDTTQLHTTRSNATVTNSPPSKRQRVEPYGNPITKLTGDEWLLIFDILRDEDPWFLSRLCLVSKAFHALATPLLYRSVVLPRRLDDLTKQPDGLLCRLLSDSNLQLRACIQELTVPQIAASYSKKQRDDFEDSGCLAQLVEHLPNLRLVRLMHPLSFTDRCFQLLDGHPNKPKLHILAVQGWEGAPSRALNCVSIIKASILRERRLPPRDDHMPSMMQNFQRLFFSCPNLKQCSLTMYGPFENPNTLATLGMTGEEKFPPLEKLSFNGYSIHPDDWPHWRDRFCWSSLSSLEVGPQTDFADRLLQQLHGYTTSLKSLKVTVWTGEDEAPAQDGLERFLYSFDTLESLEITNYVCPVEAMANHPRLVRLAVHLAEDWDSDETIPWWSAADLDYLDECCPKLEVLEIDFERQSGAWDNELLKSLAKGFDLIKELTLHVRVGSVRGEEPPLTPVLNYQSAREIGSTFFKTRQQSFEFFRSRPPNKKMDRLEKVFLKTGWDMHLLNNLAHDGSKEVERINKNTFELRKTGHRADELMLIHPERDHTLARSKQGYPGATAEKAKNVIRAGEIGALHEDQLERIDGAT